MNADVLGLGCGFAWAPCINLLLAAFIQQILEVQIVLFILLINNTGSFRCLDDLACDLLLLLLDHLLEEPDTGLGPTALMPQDSLPLILFAEVVEPDFVELHVKLAILLAVIGAVYDASQREAIELVGFASLELVLDVEFELSVFSESKCAGVEDAGGLLLLVVAQTAAAGVDAADVQQVLRVEAFHKLRWAF